MSSDEHHPSDCIRLVDALEKRMEKRMEDHSEKFEKHDQRLGLGDVGFAEVRKDIHAMTIAINALANDVKNAILSNRTNWWEEIVKAGVFWIVPVIGMAIFWAVIQSGSAGVK